MNKTLKTTLLLIIAATLSACSFNQTKETQRESDWIKYELKGKVKSYRTTSYNVIIDANGITEGTKGGKGESGDFGDMKYKYDKEGNKIEEAWYNAANEISGKRIYNYDDKGRILEDHWYDSENNLISKKTYNYDEKGNHIGDDLYHDNKILRKYTYKLNIKGNRTESNEYNPNERLISKRIYNYDPDGENAFEELYYDLTGELIRKTTFKYDSGGKTIEKMFYNSEDILERQDFFVYDDRKNLIALSLYDVKSDSFEGKWTGEYEYDEKGNWIKRTEFVFGIPAIIIKREYEYYE